MFEYSVVCILSASYMLFCAFTAGAWTSPSISKLNATDGPFAHTLTTDESSWLGSLPTLGCTVGPVLGGYLCERFGKKTSILFHAVLMATSYFTMAFAKVMWAFYTARLLTGFSMGSLFPLIVIYISETSLNEHRGVLLACIGIFASAGPVFALATGPYMSVRNFNLLLGSLPLIFVLEFFFVGIETPHYYIKKGEYELARKVLRKLRRGSDKAIEDEINLIKHLIKSQEVGTIYDIFRSKGTIKALVIILTLFALVQLSGVTIIQTYAQEIFEKAGTDVPAELCAIILGVVSLVTSMTTPVFIMFLGRKTVLICTALATCLGEILFGVYFLLEKEDSDIGSTKIIPVILLMFIVIASSAGLSLVPIMLSSEIFPNAIKEVAANLCVSWAFLVGFMVAKYFPILVEMIGQGEVFISFGICTFSIAVFTYFVVIETKGKTLKDILDELNS